MIDRLERNINWNWLDELAAWTVEQAIIIQQIPAPTFAEKARAEHVMGMFQSLGLTDIDIDDVCNVYGRLPGRRHDAPAILLSAHTDTVFPIDTDLSLHREGDTITGAGLGDNSIGVAGLLALISALSRMSAAPETDLWFVAPSREEGLGDCGGMRAAFERLKPKISSVINVEGLAFGHIYHAGIAVRRLKITAHAPGGHSWLHFGRPSAIHCLMQLGAQIITLQPPQTPRTTFNIGIIEGGRSINSIATEASMWLDLRSEESGALAVIERRVRQIVNTLSTDEVSFTIEVVGDRPSGSVSLEHPLVVRAQEVLAQLGVRATLETGSTDGNIPLSQGCPTVTIGITRGGNAHRLDEYIEVSPVASGLRQLVLLTLATADAVP